MHREYSIVYLVSAKPIRAFPLVEHPVIRRRNNNGSWQFLLMEKWTQKGLDNDRTMFFSMEFGN